MEDVRRFLVLGLFNFSCPPSSLVSLAGNGEGRRNGEGRGSGLANEGEAYKLGVLVALLNLGRPMLVLSPRTTRRGGELVGEITGDAARAMSMSKGIP